MDKRDRLMMTVQARLDRVSAARDLNPVLEKAALGEARKLTQTLTDDPGSLPARHLLGWLHWYRYQALPERDGQQDLQVATTMFTSCFINGTSGLPGPLLPFLADRATPAATELLALAQRSGNQELLSAATDLWQRILTATPADHPSRVVILSNLGSALATRFQRMGVAGDLDAGIACLCEAVQATPADHPDRTGFLSNLGTALFTRFQRAGVAGDLDAAIGYLREAVQATPADHPSRAVYLSNLGSVLWARFERAGAAGDLDAATGYLREAVQATPADHPSRAGYLSNLGIVLWARFERTGATEDLDAAVEAGQQAVRATPADHPSRAMYLLNLGTALGTRFERTGAVEDLDAAIEVGQQAVRATPADHPSRAGFLSNLGTALWARFERTAAVADLDAAIAAGQQAVQATPADHPSRAMYLLNLGTALLTRFERTGAVADLDAAIEAGQQAVQGTPADHPNRSGYLSNLGTALEARFERAGAAGDLDAAIAILREAVQATPADHPDRAGRLSNLGSALQARFERAGAGADLDAAIDAGQQAVQATPADHPSRAGYLSNLGTALRTKFQRTGAVADLDAAIQAGQQAVQASPADHPSRAMYLSNLGTALLTRFQHTAAARDLDAAIQVEQQAVQATPGDHPDRAGRLSNLGNSLWARFERVGATEDLDAAVDAGQQAVQATPADHPSRAMYLSNLGNSLRTRFQSTGAIGDLDAAIQAGQQAVQATPADHPSRAMYLSNLGNSLRTRFQSTGAIGDLDAAIQAEQRAVQVTPADYPIRAVILSNLGNSLRARFQRTGAAEDLDAAFQSYAEAATLDVAAASARIDAGRAAALLVAKTDPGTAASLLEMAVLLLPEVAPRSLERGDQQYAVGRFAGLASDAAALALSDPAVPAPQRPARALRLLEAARGVLLSQALSTRGDLSELRQRHPELAERFIELRDWLDQPSLVVDTDLGHLPGDRTVDALQRATRDRRQADAEFTQLLAHVRGLEGFGTFALPPSIGQLEAQAEQGPVVILNVSAYRSDAILLTSGGITSQPLPDLDPDTVTNQVIAFYEALDTIAASQSPFDRVNAQKTIRQILAQLWDNAARPVLDALGYRERPLAEESWPRLWWVPGGLLSLLPVHAAGYHTTPPDPGHRTVMDLVISSYTPTVGALAHARAAHPAAALGMTMKSLIIAMPTTPDMPDGADLAHVPAEAKMLEERLPNPTVLSEPLSTDDTARQLATKAAVLSELPGRAIAHFACHGYTDPADPSQSRLLLHDHRHYPLTVAALASVTLDHAQLAYLSACNTARATDPRLLDEAIHLATAFQLAGFPHVVGTLWEINDASAVEITDTFYAAMTNPDGTLDPHRAARALHHATRAQRDRWPAVPYLWASHIHAGA